MTQHRSFPRPWAKGPAASLRTTFPPPPDSGDTSLGRGEGPLGPGLGNADASSLPCSWLYPFSLQTEFSSYCPVCRQPILRCFPLAPCHASEPSRCVQFCLQLTVWSMAGGDEPPRGVPTGSPHVSVLAPLLCSLHFLFCCSRLSKPSLPTFC